MHKQIMKRLTDNGYEAYIVGGYVRDHLLGIDSQDVDLATDAPPCYLDELFSDHDVNMVGINFLVTIIDGVEVATYRHDLVDKSGAAPVESIEEDVARRDFTINAMAYDINTGEVIDYFGGKEDLKNGVIRFVGDPSERICEDPIRSIRACRFAAYMSNKGLGEEKPFKIDINSMVAIMKHKDLIDEVPKERLNKEIMKVMSTCDKPSIFFEKLYRSNTLRKVLPELQDCMYFSGGKYHSEYIHEHLFDCCDNLPKGKQPLLRLAGLLHDIGKPVVYNPETFSFLKHEEAGAEMSREIMKRLKFSNKEIDYVSNLILLHMRNLDLDSKPKAVRRLLADCVKLHVPWRDLLLLKFADRSANRRRTPWSEAEKVEFYNMVFIEYNNPDNAFRLCELEVNGDDMLELGYVGRYIKIVLDLLMKSVISNPTLNKYDTLMSMAIGSKKSIYKEK